MGGDRVRREQGEHGTNSGLRGKEGDLFIHAIKDDEGLGKRAPGPVRW